jgi:hypothetical protein
MRKNSCGKVDILKTDYDKNISKVPELIGKHPGVIAPVTLYKINPLEFVKPASASRVSGIIEVEVRIREGNEELEKNLKKIVLTIDGKRFEFDKSPYKVDFDTSHARYRIITLKAEAIGKNEDQEDAVLASFYTNVIAENGELDKTKPLLLFGGVLEPKIENRREPWTPEMYLQAYNFSEKMMGHLMHYGFVPSFLKEVDQFAVLIDPTQLDKGFDEYTPVKLVDVLGRETGPSCDGKTYTDMIPETHWIEKTKTKLGTILRGYHIPEMGLPNEKPDIFEVFAARVISYYWQFDSLGGMRAWDQTQVIFKDIMENLKKGGHDIPWDVHSLIIGKRPAHLKNMIKKHVTENKISCVVLCDFITDLSDFEDTKGLWEEVQEAIDLVEKETGKRLPLSIVYTTGGDLKGTHPDFAEAALKMTRNEIETSGIPEDAKVGLIMGEHGYPPGNGEEDAIGINQERVRQNIRRVYDKAIPGLRKGVTEYQLGMNEFNNHPDSWQPSSMERMIDYLHRGFDAIIFQPYYFTYETIDLFEHLRHWAFEVDGIDYHHEFHGAHEILPNFRSDFDFRGTRIIITGSLLGRYERDGNLPLVQEAYKLFKDSIADTLLKKLEQL